MSDDLDLRPFERLRDLTENAAPSPGFDDAIMAAIEAEAASAEVAPASSGMLAGVERLGRRFVVVAAVAAGVCLWLSLDAQTSLDEEVIGAIDTIEVVE